MNKKKKLLLSVLVAVLIIAAGVFGITLLKGKDKNSKTPSHVMEQIVAWKKASKGIKEKSPLINDDYIKLAGNSTGDWFVFSLARMGKEDNFEAYQEALVKNVVSRYQKDGGLDPVKATEWHRIALTMEAMGYDPEHIKDSGMEINLIKDGTYDRGLTNDLDTQGVNGYIWALIALDSKGYEVPNNAHETKETMLKSLISYQMENGAFGLMKGYESVDITAMAVTALAPYKEQKEANEAIEKALDFLSKKQTERGSFVDNGVESSESSSQVIVALTSLGINPKEDKRFIKEGKTVVDALYSYQNKDGGFRHSTEEKEESNSMASEQALYALVSYDRFLEGKSALYQFK